MKRKLVIAVPLLCVVALVAWWFRPKHETLGEAFVSESSVTLWGRVAQVREPLGMLHYGERVSIIARRNDNVEVRTAAGAVGWVDARNLMEPVLWQRSIKLLNQIRAMPVQARGRTKVSTNLRVEPGRTTPRLYHFNRGVPVEIVGRATADWVQSTEEKDSSDLAETKKDPALREKLEGQPKWVPQPAPAPPVCSTTGKPSPVSSNASCTLPRAKVR